MRFAKVRCRDCQQLMDVEEAMPDMDERDVLVGWHHANPDDCEHE